MRRCSHLLVLLVLALAATPALAAWPHDPTVNVPVCTVSGDQQQPVTCSDGAGGSIIAWSDSRGSALDIYAQRLSAAGLPMWTAGGVLVCNAVNDQSIATIVPDGVSGAVIVWMDHRPGTSYGIYAQRVNSSGVPQWTANGVAMVTTTGAGTYPVADADGLGGAVIAWEDTRGTGDKIYAQRVNNVGVAQWTANGVLLAGTGSAQSWPTIASDGAAGAIVAWLDNRGGSAALFGQHLNVFGTPTWGGSGTTLIGAGPLDLPQMVSDGAGGAIIAWRFPNTLAIGAQRVNPAGLQAWGPSGSIVCQASGVRYGPQLTSDGDGGALIAWQDGRINPNNDVYVQRMGPNGAAQWLADGVPVATGTGGRGNPAITGDGTGGAVLGWTDTRASAGDVYAQHVNALGSSTWTPNGVAVSTAVGVQAQPAACGDGQGGAVLTWGDTRSLVGYDLYAQRVDHLGKLGDASPAIARVRDVPNDQGGQLNVQWTASYLDAAPTAGIFDYRVWRAVPQSALAAALRARGASASPAEAARGGRLLAQPLAGVAYYWEVAGEQAAALLPQYALVIASTSDSVGGSNPRTAVMVEARAGTSPSSPTWFSAPDSGYSVDNLPPAAPAPFTGQFGAGATHLHWGPNGERDLAGYRLYRGTNATFTPGPANLVAAVTDTGFVDPAGSVAWYKLTAVDVHGNESPVAQLTPANTLAVGDAGSALAWSLAAPWPDPARGAARVSYVLPRAAHVRIAVHDLAGRLVRSVFAGDESAGPHVAELFAGGADANALAPGVYLVRLEAGGHSLSHRFVVAR